METEQKTESKPAVDWSLCPRCGKELDAVDRRISKTNPWIARCMSCKIAFPGSTPEQACQNLHQWESAEQKDFKPLTPGIAASYNWQESNQVAGFESWEAEINYMASLGYRLVHPEYFIPHWTTVMQMGETAPKLYALTTDGPREIKTHFNCYAARLGYPLYYNLEERHHVPLQQPTQYGKLPAGSWFWYAGKLHCRSSGSNSLTFDGEGNFVTDAFSFRDTDEVFPTTVTLKPVGTPINV